MRIFEPAGMGLGVRIASIGAALGERQIDNESLHAMGYPEAPQQIKRLTGVESRWHVEPTTSTAELAQYACMQALTRAQREAMTIDELILSTSSPDQLIPSTASALHGRLGLDGAPAHQISAACSGFLFGLQLGVQAITCGQRRLLVCAAETRSKQVDPRDRATGALFGDGAGAVVLEACGAGSGILGIGTQSVWSQEDTVVLGRAEQDRLQMRDGASVYLAAVEGMQQTAQALLDHMHISWEQLALVIPHQANARLMDRFCWLAKLPKDKAYSSIARHGNTSSASIPLALDEALRAGELQAGDLVLLVAVGAGTSAGAALVRIDDDLIKTMTRQA